MVQLPIFMHKYFANVIDVADNGHCGFRPVSGLLGKSVKDHHIVRLELTIEHTKNRARYLTMFSSQERFDKIKHALTPTRIGPTPEDKWLMIRVSFAERYKHAIVLAGNQGHSVTYFPLEAKPPENERLMCLG
jgi:hypothetical protein